MPKCCHPCKDSCAACCEPCSWACTHQGSCKLPCGAPCSRLPCDRHCDKLLLCGHQCPSVCGEKCLPKKFCVECKSDPGVMGIVVNIIMRAALSDLDVHEGPLPVLLCGHALTMSPLDGYMEMTNYYEGDINLTTGAVKFVKAKSLPTHEVAVLGCPICRTPISGLLRYRRRIKYSHLVMRLKKFKMDQRRAISEAEEKFSVAQEVVMNNLPMFLAKVSKSTSPARPAPPKPKEGLHHGLGQFKSSKDMMPNSNVRLLHWSYDILRAHEQA